MARSSPETGDDVASAHRAVCRARLDQRALTLELPGPVVPALAERQGTADTGSRQERGAEHGPGDDEATSTECGPAGVAAAPRRRHAGLVHVRLRLGGRGDPSRRYLRPHRRTTLTAQQIADEHRRRAGGQAVWCRRRGAQSPAQLGDTHRNIR